MTRFHYQHVQTVSEEEFVQRGTELLERLVKDAIAKRGQCILGLSGGSTPGPIYKALALSPHSHSLPPFDAACAERSRSAQGKRGERTIDWSKVYIFLVDERYVPKDHEESNQRLIAETLLANAHIPRSNLVFPKTALSIENCVGDYEERLRSLLAEAPPDIVVLGMGEDGHIASLFPGDKEALEERKRIVVHTQIETTRIPQYTSILRASSVVSDRISITLPLLASARSILFLLKGKGKQKVFEEMVKASFDPNRYPAHALLQTGRTTWITAW